MASNQSQNQSGLPQFGPLPWATTPQTPQQQQNPRWGETFGQPSSSGFQPVTTPNPHHWATPPLGETQGGQYQGGQYRQEPPVLGAQTPSDGGVSQQGNGWLGGWFRPTAASPSHQVRTMTRPKLENMKNPNTETPGHWRDADLPPLDIPEDKFPWKKAQMLSDWFTVVKLTATSVSENYGVFVEWVVDEACAKFKESQGLIYKQSEATIIPQNMHSYERRLKLALLKVIPTRIKELAMTEGLNSIAILEKLQAHTHPGGQAECDGLISFARPPGGANTAKEALTLIEDWVTARKRMIQMGMNDVSPIEEERALLGIVANVVNKHESVNHRLKARIYNRVGDTPTSEDMKALLMFMKSELNALEVNEAANKSLENSRYDPGAGSGIECQVNAAEASRGQKGECTPFQLQKAYGFCTQWINHGTCSFGKKL